MTGASVHDLPLKHTHTCARLHAHTHTMAPPVSASQIIEELAQQETKRSDYSQTPTSATATLKTSLIDDDRYVCCFPWKSLIGKPRKESAASASKLDMTEGHLTAKIEQYTIMITRVKNNAVQAKKTQRTAEALACMKKAKCYEKHLEVLQNALAAVQNQSLVLEKMKMHKDVVQTLSSVQKIMGGGKQGAKLLKQMDDIGDTISSSQDDMAELDDAMKQMGEDSSVSGATEDSLLEELDQLCSESETTSAVSDNGFASSAGDWAKLLPASSASILQKNTTNLLQVKPANA